jgi:hypothetical protein
MRLKMSAKWLLSILITLLVSAASARAHNEPPKSHDDLTERDQATTRYRLGKVKTESLFRIAHTADGEDSARVIASRDVYDRDGNFRRGIYYDSLGTEIGSLEYTYDLDQKMQEQSQCVKDSGCERTVFLYRPDRLVALALDLTQSGQPLARLEYAYLAGDTIVRLTKRDSLGTVQYTLDYIFEPNRQTGHAVRAIKKNAKGDLRLRTEMEYDARGLVEKRIFGADDKITVRFHYERRDDGQTAAMTWYSAENKITRVAVWEYDANGLATSEITHDGAGKLISNLQYEYEYW